MTETLSHMFHHTVISLHIFKLFSTTWGVHSFPQLRGVTVEGQRREKAVCEHYTKSFMT